MYRHIFNEHFCLNDIPGILPRLRVCHQKAKKNQKKWKYDTIHEIYGSGENECHVCNICMLLIFFCFNRTKMNTRQRGISRTDSNDDKRRRRSGLYGLQIFNEWLCTIRFSCRHKLLVAFRGFCLFLACMCLSLIRRNKILILGATYIRIDLII